MALYTTNSGQINATAASMACELDRILLRATQYKAWLDTLSDANLISLYGYIQADIDVLRSATADMDKIRQIYQGLQTQGSLYDFRTFMKLLYPFGSI